MDKISSLKKLKGLLEEGIITEEEFQQQKKIILDGVVKEPEKPTSGFVPGDEKDSNLSSEQLPDNNPSVLAEEDNIPAPTIDNDDDDVVSKTEQAISLLPPESVAEEKPEMTEEEREAERIKESKARLWAGIIVCFLGIVFGVVSLLTDSLVDRLVKYEKAGIAVLQLEKSGPAPHIIVMDKKGLYYDNKITVTEIAPVGKELDTREINFHYDATNGLLATADDADKKFAIVSSRGLRVRRLTDKTYLLSTNQLSGDPLTDYNLSLEPCYLIVKNAKSKKVTVIKVPKSRTDGDGNVHWKQSSSILSQYGTFFKMALSKTDYDATVKREYCHYLAPIELSLKSGKVQIDGPIDFDKLGVSYPAKEVGTVAHRSSMQETIQGIFRRELEESFYTNATQQTGIFNRDYMKITDDDKYTFVINPYYGSGSQPKGLLRVNNKTKAVTLIDIGKEIEFLSNSICVTKIESFLIFFDSEKRVFYDYAGNRKN